MTKAQKRTLIRQAYVSGSVSLADAARRYDIHPGTARTWAFRGKWKVKESPKIETLAETLAPVLLPPPPQWRQSFNHRDAHVVTHEGRAVCDPERITGIIGKHWFPHDYVRKCRRCMGWLEKNDTQLQPRLR